MAWGCCETPKHEISLRPSEYVTTLVGTQSDYSLSTGNTYPAVALPWGMNFWTPQTGKMGDGWAYTYGSHTIRGLKQTHQPSPWINDYGQFSIMPVRGKDKVDENARQSWFSHQSETAKPYYYSVYLADHDVVAEMAPTDRAAVLRFTFPESDESGVVIDAFDRGSQVKVMPDSRTVVGYTTRNSGGVPDNFRNWFVIRFDKPFESSSSCSMEGTGTRRFVGRRRPCAGGGVFHHPPRRAGDGARGLVVHLRRAGFAQPRNRGRRCRFRDGESPCAGALGRGAGADRGLGRHRRAVPDLLFVPLSLDPVPSQILRDRRQRQSGALQPLQRRGAAGLYVYRHGFLGYVPVSVPAAEPGLPVGQRRDSGRVGQHLPRAASCPNGPRRATAAAWWATIRLP